MLALAAFFLLRRRFYRRDQDRDSSTAQNKSAKPDISELSGREVGELSGKGKSQELAAGRGQLPELPVKEKPQELSAESG